MELGKLFSEQAEALRAGRDFAVVTMVCAQNLARTSGKMIVYDDGRISGTVGGGPWEEHAVRDALACLESGENAVKTYEFSDELARAGFSCEGVLTVFIEVCRSARSQLVVIGGGHVGAAVLRLAATVGFATTLVDTRGEETIGEAIHAADRFLRVTDFADVAALELPHGAFYVVSTYGHLADGAALSGALSHTDAAYVGLLGSSKKIDMLFEKLRASGVAQETLNTVSAPIGLDLGGETPEEIALAAVSEMLCVKYGRSGARLCARK